jgi:Pentapeptide repeats (8 copies)
MHSRTGYVTRRIAGRRNIAHFAALAAAAMSAAVHGQVYRWIDGQVIPGTAGISPGPGVNYAGLSLDYALLSNQNLAGASFAGSSLQFAYLFSSNLAGANLASANLNSAYGFGSDFGGANFTNANLTSAYLLGASLQSAKLTGSTLTQSILTLTDLRGTTGYSPTGTTSSRLAIQPDGHIVAGTANGLAAGETLRIRAALLPATSSSVITGAGTVALDAGASLNLSPTGSSSTSAKSLDGVALSLGGTPALSSSAKLATATVISVTRTLAPTVAVVSSLSVAGDGQPLGSRSYFGQLDVGSNDLVVRNGSISALSDMARAGQNGATLFAGNGITSSVAAADADGKLRYAVGVIPNSFGGSAIYTSFDGVAVAATDVLAKFTYFGDADLSGSIDDTDFFLANNGYLNSLTGWLNGDFDYSGVVDDTDFFLLNNGYLNQVDALRSGASVPEPTCLATLVVAAGTGLARRRRQLLA